MPQVVNPGLVINYTGATTIAEQDVVRDEYNKAMFEFRTELAINNVLVNLTIDIVGKDNIDALCKPIF